MVFKKLRGKVSRKRGTKKKISCAPCENVESREIDFGIKPFLTRITVESERFIRVEEAKCLAEAKAEAIQETKPVSPAHSVDEDSYPITGERKIAFVVSVSSQELTSDVSYFSDESLEWNEPWLSESDYGCKICGIEF